MNSTNKLPALAMPATAAFGVFILPDGELIEVSEGRFDCGQADNIAGRLVILAAKIRNTTRRRLSESNQD